MSAPGPLAAPQPPADLALVLAGGGARGAYQAGVLRGIGKLLPDLRVPILVGVSAGAINTVFLAAHAAPLGKASEALAAVWRGLETGDVFRVDTPSLARHFTRWITRLSTGGSPISPAVRGLVDARPLHKLMVDSVPTVDGEFVGIAHNLERGQLHAVALTTLDYSTGQTVTWVQGTNVRPWKEARRRSLNSRLTVDHVMASAALPLFFPAVRLGDTWHGDGGVRLDAPLSGALRLGATRILAITPRYEQSVEEAERARSSAYPSPAQILSQLTNAIFLDVLDRDARLLELLNKLVRPLPPERRDGMYPVDIQVIRPSEDLALLAAEYEGQLPPAFRYLTRSLGTRESTTPDFLSMLMFQRDYLERLLEIGERDAIARIDAIRRLVMPERG